MRRGFGDTRTRRIFCLSGITHVSLWSAITDRIAGKDIPAVIDVTPSMRSAIEIRGAFDPERVPPYLSSRTANWADINPSRIIDTARKSVVVYACLTYLADAVAESPLRVYRSQADDRKEVPEHRARQIIANPNPFMSEAEFFALLVMCMGMQGYAIVEMVRSGGGLPVELWPLRPDWLTKKNQPDSRAAASYTYRAPRVDPREIPKEDLILIPYRHDDRLDSPGVSPLQIAAREVGIDSSLTDFLKVYLDAGGVPPFVIEYQDILDQVVIDQIQEAWAQKYGGSQAYGQIPILHGGYKIAQVGDSLNAMAWPDLRAITEDKICQAFRVPRELVQTHSTAAGGSGLTTTEQEGAMLSLQRYGATPLRNRIDGAFTRSFLNQFTGGDPQYELQFDVSDVLTLQEDADKLHTRVRADYTAGLIMLDEARQEIGMQPLPTKQGEVFAIPFNIVLTRPAELIAPELPAPTVPAIPATVPGKNGNRYRDETKLSPEVLELRKNVVAQNRRDQKRLGDVLNRKLVKFFKEQGNRVVVAAEKSQAIPPGKAIFGSGDAGFTMAADSSALYMYRPWLKSIAEIQLIDWDAEQLLLTEIMNRFYATAGDAAAGAASSALGVIVAWDLSNPNISRTMQRLGRRIVGITETTREDVARIVNESLQEGVTLDELSSRLTGQFEETYKNRSMAIARTESQYSYNTASIVSYQESGVVDSAELADNPDHDTDPGADGLTCAERNGLVVPLADVQWHIDAEHPNGTLAVLPVVTLGAE